MNIYTRYQNIPKLSLFILIILQIIFFSGCDFFNKTKKIEFIDRNKTPNVEIKISTEGKIIGSKISDQNGVVTFEGKFKKGVTYKFTISAKLKRPVMVWPERQSITIGSNNKYEVVYKMIDAGKLVEFISERGVAGIKILGSHGSVNKLLGATDQTGKFSTVLDKKEWPSIHFTAKHIDGSVSGNGLNQNFQYSQIPHSPINLTVYPRSDCYFHMRLVERGTTRSITNASVYHQASGKTWQTNSKGIVIPTLPQDLLKSLDIHLNDKITFTIKSGEFENKSQTFYINVEKYDENHDPKEISLRKVYKLNIFVKDLDGNNVGNALVTVGGVKIGRTDKNGLITYDYEIGDVNQSLTLRASKKKYMMSDRKISLPSESGRQFNILIEKIMPVEIIIQDEEDGSNLSDKMIDVGGNTYTTNSYGVIEVYPNNQIADIRYSYSGNDNFHYAKKGAFKATPSKRVFYLQLKPRTVLNFQCYANLGGGQRDPLDKVQIKIDGKIVGRTREDGTLQYPLNATQVVNTLKIQATRRGFEPESDEVVVTSSRHIVELYLSGIIGQVIVEDVYGNPIKGIEVDLGGQIFPTNRTGRANILLDQLNRPLELVFFDPD